MEAQQEARMRKDSKMPAYFTAVHFSYLLFILAFDALDMFVGLGKSREVFVLINIIDFFSWSIILPGLFISAIAIQILFRKNGFRRILPTAAALILNIAAWFFTVASAAAKF